MLIEIHLLQNHSPGNPNRDDVGAPKSAYFGGRLRGRISSQCLKRSIRKFTDFREALAGRLGERTKLFPHLVGERLKTSTIPAEEHAQIVAACSRIAKSEKKDSGAAEREKKADPRPQTPQLIYLDPAHVEEFVKRLQEQRSKMRKEYDHFCDPIAGFQQFVEAALEGSDLPEALQDKVIGYAWVIAKSRMELLSQTADEDEPQPTPNPAADQDPGEQDAEWIVQHPGEQDAEWIVQRITRLQLSDKPKDKEQLKTVCKKPGKEETKLVKPKMSKAEQKAYTRFKDQIRVPLTKCPVDIALFGRMTTSDAFEDVEACLEVAHAMSTNEMVREVDYFTAVDDRGLSAAAAHVGENQFTSCTYYKYFSLDWKAFVAKLAGKKEPTSEHAGKKPTPQEWAEANALARKAVRALIHAAAHAVPSGKKKGHANNNLPDAVLVEVKSKRIPTSYANAFLKPVVPPPESDLLKESVRYLGHYVGLVGDGYGLHPQRFWFYLHQGPLAMTPKGEDNKPPQPETLAESLPSFDALLDAVDKAVAAAGGER